MPIQTNEIPDEGLLDMEANDCVPELNANPKNIGWNLTNMESLNQQSGSVSVPMPVQMLTTPNFLTEVQVSHRQITERFVELLNLFEDYSRIIKESEQAQLNPQPKLKRTQSEQFTATHLQPADTDSGELLKATVSLSRVQHSDSTLLGAVPKLTCDVASQTYWPGLVPEVGDKEKLLKPKLMDPVGQLQPLLEPEARTIHIEVDSISSVTAFERRPLCQRMWRVLYETGHALTGCLSMMGENFTYVLFVLVCVWCLYLIIAHYHSFIASNVHQQQDPKLVLAGIRAKPNLAP